MRNRIILSAALFLLAAVFNLRLNAQTSEKDVPRILSYQGQITTTNGIVMNGTHNITATLYSDPHGTNSVWMGSFSAVITNGIFSVDLGTGANKLPDNATMNQPLWVGISVDEGKEMQPLTQFAAAPYALNVPDQSITFAKPAPEVALGMGTGHTPTTQGISFDPCSTNGDGGLYSTSFVGGGCGNTTPSNYNVIAGGETNTISAGSGESAILGGYLNTLYGDYSILCGGESNSVNTTYYAFLGGGNLNTVSADFASVLGGVSNTASASYATVIGGGGNEAAGSYSTVLGGSNLKLGSGSAGFNGNSAASFDESATSNIFFLNDADILLQNWGGVARKFEFFATGVSGTPATNFTSFEAGSQSGNIRYILPNALGSTNTVLMTTTSGTTGTLSWVDPNTLITATSSWYLTGNSGTTSISDGGTNFLGTIDNKAFEISVFNGNTTANQGTGVVMRFEPQAFSGASTNIIGGFHTSTLGASNHVGGGVGNVICGGGSSGLVNSTTSDDFNAIVGGEHNTAAEGHAFVGGGLSNSALEELSAVVGGENNNILGEASGTDGGDHSFIGGGGGGTGLGNQISSEFSCIVGGQKNIASAIKTFIGGGSVNTATNGWAVVVGGTANNATGEESAIGDGDNNNANALGSNIPGGEGLNASGVDQTVIGAYNLARTDRMFIIGAGSSSLAQFNAYEVTPAGAAIVFSNTNNTAASVEGTRTIDNTNIAWGDIPAGTANGPITPNSAFGIVSVTRGGVGNNQYTVVLNYVDHSATPAQIDIHSAIAVVATPVFDTYCSYVTVDPPTFTAGHTQFIIRTWGAGSTCTTQSNRFMFHVLGRP